MLHSRVAVLSRNGAKCLCPIAMGCRGCTSAQPWVPTEGYGGPQETGMQKGNAAQAGADPGRGMQRGVMGSQSHPLVLGGDRGVSNKVLGSTAESGWEPEPAPRCCCPLQPPNSHCRGGTHAGPDPHGPHSPWLQHSEEERGVEQTQKGNSKANHKEYSFTVKYRGLEGRPAPCGTGRWCRSPPILG